MPRSDQTTSYFSGRALVGPRIQCVATEEIDFFEVREQPRAGGAARHALHLVDRQILARHRLIREEFIAPVVVAGNDQDVAADVLTASRCQPIRPPLFHQLDELKLVGRQASSERLLLVGGIANQAVIAIMRVSVALLRSSGGREGSATSHRKA